MATLDFGGKPALVRAGLPPEGN